MIDGGDQKLAPISDAVADMKSGLVNSRRSMMVFRARMQSLEDIIDDIGTRSANLIGHCRRRWIFWRKPRARARAR